MKREVKFRGKTYKEGSSESKWVYGYLYDDARTGKLCVDEWLVKPDTVGQYTGLKDKNGAEIYEGDIIKAKHDDGRYDIGSVVYGRKGAFCIDLPKVATGIKSPLLNYIHGIMFDESYIEVIGNIHDNPMILEAR